MTRNIKTLVLSLGLSLVLGVAAISFAQTKIDVPAKDGAAKVEKDACCAGETAATTGEEKTAACPMMGAAKPSADAAKGAVDTSAADMSACPMQGADASACPVMKATAEKATAATTTKEKATAKVAIKELGNTLCPITGEKVGSMEKGMHVDYKGTRVGLCCSGCVKKFMKDPEAGLSKAKESVPQAKS